MQKLAAAALILAAVSLTASCAATQGEPPRWPGEAAVTGGPVAAGLHAIPVYQATPVYVARRRWHIDVGFAAADLRGPLSRIANEFPGTRYLFFGFGDRRYLLSKHHDGPVSLAALWPGPGLMLVTAIEGTPRQAFGPGEVIELHLSGRESQALQEFIGRSFAGIANEGSVAPYAAGPYPGSAYFAAVPRYSGLHTCITWVAEALRSAGVPVRSRLTLIAGQLWRQLLHSGRARALAGIAADPQSQGGGLPF